MEAAKGYSGQEAACSIDAGGSYIPPLTLEEQFTDFQGEADSPDVSEKCGLAAMRSTT